MFQGEKQMNRTNMSAVIEVAIEQKLDRGIRDKQEIFSQVVTELNVPRPTVRRVARDLRIKYLDKVKVLQSDFDTHYESRKVKDDDYSTNKTKS